MPNIDATIQIVGEKQAYAMLSKLEKGMLNFKKPFERVIIWMHKSFADSFRSGKRGTKKWKPNQPWTRQIKKGSNVLQEDGYLRSSLTGVTGKSYRKQTATKLEFGTTVLYAEIHQKGKTIPVTEATRGYFASVHGLYFKKSTDHIKIPARPFMFFTRKDVKKIKQIFEKWMQEEVDKIATG